MRRNKKKIRKGEETELSNRKKQKKICILEGKEREGKEIIDVKERKGKEIK